MDEVSKMDIVKGVDGNNKIIEKEKTFSKYSVSNGFIHNDKEYASPYGNLQEILDESGPNSIIIFHEQGGLGSIQFAIKDEECNIITTYAENGKDEMINNGKEELCSFFDGDFYNKNSINDDGSINKRGMFENIYNECGSKYNYIQVPLVSKKF